MHNKIFKVAIIGPESSGKTTLCKQLAEHFNTIWVKEFARDYILNLKRKYTQDDISYCITEQVKLEDELLLKANRIMFCDTETIISKVWMLDTCGYSPLWIDKLIQDRVYDLFFLTKPDLPFIPDGVRENGDRRNYFYDWYKNILEENNFPFLLIEGTGEMRTRIAIDRIEQMLSVNNG